MTAASSIIHEEFHGRDFARRGGIFEMVRVCGGERAGQDIYAHPRVDFRLAGGQRTELDLPDGYTMVLVLVKGAVRVNG
jgi:redox-sensitive bicupin YhaK (pirin superfamily)